MTYLIIRGVTVCVALACIGLAGDFLLPSTVRWTVSAQSECRIMRGGKPVTGNQDALARILASSNPCPRDVVELRRQIASRGGTFATAFINNRGFHNPDGGSFSLFEVVTGDLSSIGRVSDGEFFFGHFTTSAGPRLILDQSPSPSDPLLMVEAIAWDPGKSLFNFYELIGAGSNRSWDYKGDSADILAETAGLHLNRPQGAPSITRRLLRCASCHVNGGPIMRELAPPHNDWWTAARKLPLGGLQLDNQITAIAAGFVDGDRFAAGVRTGLTKLAASAAFQEAARRRSLQEQLRPLFCPAELNLESDAIPLDDNMPTTSLPSALLVDSRLAQARLETARADYDAALRSTRSKFPEIDRADADRAWFGPVKATSDQMRVQSLVDAKLIDEEFVADVLAVDFTNPVLSKGRCDLLKRVPREATPDWRDQFLTALQSSTDASAKELVANLTSADRTAASHRQRAGQLLTACAEKLKTREFVAAALALVQQRRSEVRDNDISKGQGGMILEPGFKVIFPEPSSKPKPGARTLSASCVIS
jgi:hypothetical protein